jgi:ABC-2 type transport system ATP-binding protein
MAVSKTVIDVHGIGKRYKQPGRGWVAVLQDVDLQAGVGSVLGLLGPNGAGKTTLIKILAGLLRPDSGGGTVLGFDLLHQHDEVRARVSLVAPTADVGIDNNLTVRQNLAFWAPIYGLHGARARSRIDELLARLGLADKADAWPMHISAGQRQRLALARSLLAETPLLFLDEPTNKLDLEGVRSVRQMIAELNREHDVTIVLTTHVMEEAEELCGEIALLREGQLVAHQPTAALTLSLGLARPIAVTLRSGTLLPPGWEAEVRALPGVVAVTRVLSQGDGGAVQVLRVESLDLRAATPALLDWLRAHQLGLVSMQAEPVTLTDVFTALAARRVETAPDRR